MKCDICRKRLSALDNFIRETKELFSAGIIQKKEYRLYHFECSIKKQVTKK